MQRVAQSTIPPRQSTQQQACSSHSPQNASPAFIMAMRIRNEQGPQRAAQYLAAMEPFIAPAERAYISNRLGLPSAHASNPPFSSNPWPFGAPQSSQCAPDFSKPPSGQNYTDGASQAGANPFAGNNPFANAGGMPNMNTPAGLMQLLSMMNNGGSAKNMPDPAMLAMLMNMMNKKS